MLGTGVFIGLFMLYAFFRHHWMKACEIGYRSARTRLDYVTVQTIEATKVLVIWTIIILTIWAAYELLCILKDYALSHAPHIDLVITDPDQ
jgi:hypothetical protein